METREAKLSFLVRVFINLIALGIDPGRIDFKPGANPSTTSSRGAFTLATTANMRGGDFGGDFELSFGLGWSVVETRIETNIGGGDRIVLRSKPIYLSLLHTCSIISTKIEVEMVVGRVVIPNIFQFKGVHPPVFRPRQPH